MECPTSAVGKSFLVSSVILLFTQRVKSNMTDRCPEDKSSGGVWGEAPGFCLWIWEKETVLFCSVFPYFCAFI